MMYFISNTVRDVLSFVIIFVVIAIIWYVVNCGFSNGNDKNKKDEQD